MHSVPSCDGGRLVSTSGLHEKENPPNRHKIHSTHFGTFVKYQSGNVSNYFIFDASKTIHNANIPNGSKGMF